MIFGSLGSITFFRKNTENITSFSFFFLGINWWECSKSPSNLFVFESRVFVEMVKNLLIIKYVHRRVPIWRKQLRHASEVYRLNRTRDRSGRPILASSFWRVPQFLNAFSFWWWHSLFGLNIRNSWWRTGTLKS